MKAFYLIIINTIIKYNVSFLLSFIKSINLYNNNNKGKNLIPFSFINYNINYTKLFFNILLLFMYNIILDPIALYNFINFNSIFWIFS